MASAPRDDHLGVFVSRVAPAAQNKKLSPPAIKPKALDEHLWTRFVERRSDLDQKAKLGLHAVFRPIPRTELRLRPRIMPIGGNAITHGRFRRAFANSPAALLSSAALLFQYSLEAGPSGSPNLPPRAMAAGKPGPRRPRLKA
jgi:hypothetical protein